MTNSFNMSDWRRKYVLMAENDIQYPMYDPKKHKTLMVGAIDYELIGDKIKAFLPFEEEPEYMVEFPDVNKSELEDWLGIEIETQEDLDRAEMNDIRKFYMNKINPRTNSLMEDVAGEEDLDFYMDKIITLAQKAKDTWSKDDRMNYFRAIEQAVRDAEFYIKTLPKY